MANMTKAVLFASLSFFLSTMLFSGGNAESHTEMTGVVSKMLIKATPQEVFDAIRQYRHCDSRKRSVIEESNGRATIKEKFAGLPILGDVECTYEETEIPYSRVEYQLVSSDKLKIFEGNWILTPVSEGDSKSTMVRLTSYVDSNVQVPAKDFLQHLSAHEDIHKRLAFVKKVAEHEDLQREQGG
ncbi:MAG: hypothetical protein K2X93_07590 [Candidatus Obscuribacterales bacterium]|nr:hypothetical protein [Candidatus Obscuribacterales bacterium]